MNKIKYLIVIYLFFVNVLFSQEKNINKYRFEVYFLIKGQMKKIKEMPNFGWRILKAFPLKVKEYTFTSKYYDYNSTEIIDLANKITKNLSDARKKNAVYIANEIYNYINNNIGNREINKEIKGSPHKIYFSYKQVLKEKKGCDLEKCRLAVTLFRYFTIPARMVYINDHYAVEYFIMPLKGKGDWFLMEFGNTENIQGKYTFPIYWHPLDCKEIINETWDNNCYIDKLEIKDIFLNYDEKKAESIYNQITMSAQNLEQMKSEQISEKGKFIMLKKILYELWLPQDQKIVKVNFILPFNTINFFRTKYWHVRTLDANLEIKMKRIYTEIKPPQEGMIVTLPVEFMINSNN